MPQSVEPTYSSGLSASYFDGEDNVRNEGEWWRDEKYLRDKVAREAEEAEELARERANEEAEEAQIVYERTT